jgi:hypothetical protein
MAGSREGKPFFRIQEIQIREIDRKKQKDEESKLEATLGSTPRSIASLSRNRKVEIRSDSTRSRKEKEESEGEAHDQR